MTEEEIRETISRAMREYPRVKTDCINEVCYAARLIYEKQQEELAPLIKELRGISTELASHLKKFRGS